MARFDAAIVGGDFERFCYIGIRFFKFPPLFSYFACSPQWKANVHGNFWGIGYSKPSRHLWSHESRFEDEAPLFHNECWPGNLKRNLRMNNLFLKGWCKEILTEWDFMISYSFMFLQTCCSSKMMESSKASEGTQASAESLKDCRVTPNSLRGRSAIWIHTSWRESFYKEKTSTLEENMQP